MSQAAGQTDDPRMKPLAAANIGFSPVDAAQATKTAASDPNSTNAASISITVGSSRSRSVDEQTRSTTRGSSIEAGGNISIRATGGGTDSDLTIRGSTVRAGGDIGLKADGDIALLAAGNTVEQDSSHSSQSAAAGLAISVGQSTTGACRHQAALAQGIVVFGSARPHHASRTCSPTAAPTAPTA